MKNKINSNKIQKMDIDTTVSVTEVVEEVEQRDVTEVVEEVEQRDVTEVVEEVEEETITSEDSSESSENSGEESSTEEKEEKEEKEEEEEQKIEEFSEQEYKDYKARKEEKERAEEEDLNWQWNSITLIIRTFLVFVGIILLFSFFLHRYQSDPTTVQFYWDRYYNTCCNVSDTLPQKLLSHNTQTANSTGNTCSYSSEYQCDRFLNLWLYSKGIDQSFLQQCCYWYGDFNSSWWSVKTYCRADCLTQ